VNWYPCLIRTAQDAPRLGHPLVDDYLVFVAARLRPNSLKAVAFDFKVFFSVIPKDPVDVTSADVFTFVKAQRQPRRGERVVRLDDGESGLAARTIARRLSSLGGLFNYLVARGDTGVVINPVPRGLTTRPAGGRRRAAAPIIRRPRTLPRVLSPPDVDALVAALRTLRDRAMVEAMLLGGLRRCEVLGVRLADVNAGERRLFVAEGKGGHQRLVPVSGRFFGTVGEYLERVPGARAPADLLDRSPVRRPQGPNAGPAAHRRWPG
jgi:site-specific recombinase XerD